MWYYWLIFVLIGVMTYIIWFIPEIMAKKRAKRQLKASDKIRDCAEKGIEYYGK